MKTDVNGCSTCAAGREQYEYFYLSIVHGERVQYDYRTPDGRLFSTVAKTLEIARERRDQWLAKNGLPAASETVPTISACPQCGERMMDNLVWNEDGERVSCATCGMVYKPGK